MRIQRLCAYGAEEERNAAGPDGCSGPGDDADRLAHDSTLTRTR
jgi:hypothetical protein